MTKRYSPTTQLNWVLILVISIPLLAIAAAAGRFALARTSPAAGAVAADPTAAATTGVPAPLPYADFLDRFAAANPGLFLQLVDQKQAPIPFAAEMVQFNLHGEMINLYIYTDPIARQQVSDRIAPDGGSYSEIDSGGAYLVTRFELTDYPHFWSWDRVLIDYVGHDGAVIDALTNAFGSQFAGGAFYASSMEMLTAQEWALSGWGTPALITAVIPAITRVRFGDGQMSGFTGVNDFSLPFVLDEDQPSANFHKILVWGLPT